MTKQHPQVSTSEAATVAHAALGALVGGVVAGPVGLMVGAAAGVMVEKGPARRSGAGEKSKTAESSPKASG